MHYESHGQLISTHRHKSADWQESRTRLLSYELKKRFCPKTLAVMDVKAMHTVTCNVTIRKCISYIS